MLSAARGSAVSHIASSTMMYCSVSRSPRARSAAGSSRSASAARRTRAPCLATGVLHKRERPSVAYDGRYLSEQYLSRLFCASGHPGGQATGETAWGVPAGPSGGPVGLFGDGQAWCPFDARFVGCQVSKVAKALKNRLASVTLDDTFFGPAAQHRTALRNLLAPDVGRQARLRAASRR